MLVLKDYAYGFIRFSTDSKNGMKSKTFETYISYTFSMFSKMSFIC